MIRTALCERSYLQSALIQKWQELEDTATAETEDLDLYFDDLQEDENQVLFNQRTSLFVGINIENIGISLCVQTTKYFILCS